MFGKFKKKKDLKSQTFYITKWKFTYIHIWNMYIWNMYIFHLKFA